MAGVRGLSFLLVCLRLIAILATAEGRAVPHPTRQPLWQPEGDMDREEFLRYHGYGKEEWTRMKETLQQIIELRDNLTSEDQAWLDSVIPHTQSENVSFEGCSWMSPEQVDYLRDMIYTRISGTPGGKRTKRQLEDFSSAPFRKWSNPIFFKFDGTHDDKELSIIRAAFRHWQEQTCLRFFEINVNAHLDFPHLLITKQNRGCFSFVGRVRVIPQQLNLASKCLQRFGTPVHEIGHVLGLWHEQQRWDRDEHIRVVTENLGPFQSQFWRSVTRSHGVPYDYGSVMHYGPTDGSYNGGNTIQTIDPLFQQSLGQRVGLSFFDAKLINAEYCSAVCWRPLPEPCQRGGYQDPNNCEICRCPDGFGGKFCETVAPSNAPCGGLVKAGEDAKFIESPGYDSVSHYDDNQECHWLIKAPAGHHVRLTFLGEFGFYCYKSQSCHHWLEVRYKGDLSAPGPRFCCYKRPRVSLLSEKDEMLVVLRANFSTPWTTVRRGFLAAVTAEFQAPIVEAIAPEDLGTTTYTATTTTTTTATTTENPPGTRWGPWSRCQDGQCKCGGCSVSTRRRLCGSQRCRGKLAASQKKVCDRTCTKSDNYLSLTGRIIEMPCPTCCDGFTRKGDTCIPDTS